MSTQDMPEPQVAAGAPARVLIVRAPYYRAVVDGMAAGAERLLARAKAEIATEDVAGAFELPQAIRIVLGATARGGPRWDGFIALGCVVRGDTDHYDHICRETHRGLMEVALTYGIALGTGVLTVHDEAQAIARAGADRFNKGAEAAAACLAQIALMRKLAP